MSHSNIDNFLSQYFQLPVILHDLLQHVVLEYISRDEKICRRNTRKVSKGQASNLVIFAFL